LSCSCHIFVTLFRNRFCATESQGQIGGWPRSGSTTEASALCLAFETWATMGRMTKGLVRYQQSGQFHFVTFSCYERQPHLGSAAARAVFERSLETMRRHYHFVVSGYVVMPEHVLLVGAAPTSVRGSCDLGHPPADPTGQRDSASLSFTRGRMDADRAG
jgi:hypothetical protein